MNAKPIVEAAADETGNIDVKPATRWALLFIGMDFIQEPVRLLVEADGYQTMSLDDNFVESPSFKKYMEFGIVRLHRIAASQPAMESSSIKTFFGKEH